MLPIIIVEEKKKKTLVSNPWAVLFHSISAKMPIVCIIKIQIVLRALWFNWHLLIFQQIHPGFNSSNANYIIIIKKYILNHNLSNWNMMLFFESQKSMNDFVLKFNAISFFII